VKARAPRAAKGERLTVAEAAEVLGVSKRTTRRLIDSGELPAYRPSQRTLWLRQEDLEEYLETRKTTEKVGEG